MTRESPSHQRGGAKDRSGSVFLSAEGPRTLETRRFILSLSVESGRTFLHVSTAGTCVTVLPLREQRRRRERRWNNENLFRRRKSHGRLLRFYLTITGVTLHHSPIKTASAVLEFRSLQSLPDSLRDPVHESVLSIRRRVRAFYRTGSTRRTEEI